jgi:hypothetical protein
MAERYPQAPTLSACLDRTSIPCCQRSAVSPIGATCGPEDELAVTGEMPGGTVSRRRRVNECAAEPRFARR